MSKSETNPNYQSTNVKTVLVIGGLGFRACFVFRISCFGFSLQTERDGLRAFVPVIARNEKEESKNGYGKLDSVARRHICEEHGRSCQILPVAGRQDG